MSKNLRAYFDEIPIPLKALYSKAFRGDIKIIFKLFFQSPKFSLVNLKIARLF